MAYRIVPSKRQPETPLLEVSYLCPARAGARWVKAWLCPEYDGYPRQLAEAWFARRESACPRRTATALALAQRLPRPRSIVVAKDGTFDRVVMEYFETQEDTKKRIDISHEIPYTS
jgi:hypothetical protein